MRNCHSSIAFLILAISFHLRQILPCAASPTRGFSVDLIHRDYSPQSPYYDPNETRSQRLNRDLLRSTSRAKHIVDATNQRSEPITEIRRSVWSYLMKISIGTPRVPILAVVDTGSSLIWTQCDPCFPCFQQPHLPFDPFKSVTYKPVNCYSSTCSFPFECGQHGLCKYKVKYEDGSFSMGTLAKETITISTSSFNKIVIGCGHSNNKTSRDTFSGIVGLGRGSLSLLSQIENAIDGKFAYCLVSYSSIDEASSPGKLYFGYNAAVSGPGVVSTPLITKKSGFFYLHLEGISVSDTRVECENTLSDLLSNTSGNMIIDSGSALTYLPRACYLELESEISKRIKLERIPDPQEMLSLCYRTTLPEVETPMVKVHFLGGSLELGPRNLFIKVSEDVACFGFVPQHHSLSVYGSIAQADFLVGYDIKNNVLSFKRTEEPHGCAGSS